MTRTALALLALLPACGQASGLPAGVVEAAYRDARATAAVCRPGDAACCDRQVAAARSAADPGAAARLWDDVALACPERRAEATAAVAAGGKATPGIGYRVRLPPAVRLLWVGAVNRGGDLEVEVQAIRFSGARPGPLLAASRRFDLPSARAVTIDIDEAPSGLLELDAHAEPILPPPRPRSSPPRPAPPPHLERARPVRLSAPRAPGELGPLPPGPAVRLCLDRDGQLDTLRFLEPAHPRIAASVIDAFRDARHEPYRVDDRAVPSCQVTRPAIENARRDG